MLSFQENNKIVRLSNAVAAGTSDVDPTAVDMAGFNSVTFVVLFGAIVSGALTSVKAQQSSDNGSTDGFSDIAGSAVTVADTDDNKVAVLEIHNPEKRYVKPFVDRGTQNATVDGIIAILSNPRELPIDDDTTVIEPVLLAAPAEGTA